MNDSVNNPKHYTQFKVNGQPLECIDVIEALNLPMHLGNALKYIWRYRDKGGLQDLRKAAWYLARYADWQEAKHNADSTTQT